MWRRLVAFSLLASSSASFAQVSTDCIHNGPYTNCRTYPGAPQADPNALLRGLIDTTGQQANILRQAQADALQRRIVEQQLAADEARAANEQRAQQEAAVSQARDAVGRLIAAGDCPTARRLAAYYGFESVKASVASACP